MFIQYLNSEQQAILITFTKKIIAVDGHIDEKEELMLETIRSQCDVNVNLDSNPELDELGRLFEFKHQKVAFILELIGVAYADETYQDSEKAVIGHLAEILNISPSLLIDMESWVKRQMILVKEANLLMEI
ncbi:TerB family tellurite resistance protein [Vibrio misgurnus]|uniref:TerB family tellurite resistance protein n=1 Tax=Vibrio misgurnus TaxID=2993714 RepID=UPI002418078D|nr:TerB family tellurite resistance protein [Vibrio sp. gvc]